MARYASENALVTLITCTLGEEGEIVVPHLEHLASEPRGRPGLAPHRGAGGRLRGARREGSPVPRRPRPVARLRDDGRADERQSGVASGRPISPRPPAIWSRSCARPGRRSSSPTTRTAATATPTTSRRTTVTVAAFDLSGDPGLRARARRALGAREAVLPGDPAQPVHRGNAGAEGARGADPGVRRGARPSSSTTTSSRPSSTPATSSRRRSRRCARTIADRGGRLLLRDGRRRRPHDVRPGDVPAGAR